MEGLLSLHGGLAGGCFPVGSPMSVCLVGPSRDGPVSLPEARTGALPPFPAYFSRPGWRQGCQSCTEGSGGCFRGGSALPCRCPRRVFLGPSRDGPVSSPEARAGVLLPSRRFWGVSRRTASSNNWRGHLCWPLSSDFCGGHEHTRWYSFTPPQWSNMPPPLTAWRDLNSRLGPGYVLVVAAVDRIGRRWMDTVSTLRDLRGRQVRVRSLAPSEQQWTRYFDAGPDSPEAVIGDVQASFFTWAAQQELESIRRRTKAGLDKARSNGKTLGTPRKMTDLKVEMARSFRRDGLSFKQIETALGVSRTTVGQGLEGELRQGQ